MKFESFINSINGEHFDVIANVSVALYKDEVDYSRINQIEICPSEERLQCNVGKFSGLHELPRMYFSKDAVDQLQRRLEQACAEEVRRDDHFRAGNEDRKEREEELTEDCD